MSLRKCLGSTAVAFAIAAALALLGCLVAADARALTVNVVDTAGNPVSGFRWLVERDNTVQRTPGVAATDSISLAIHNSHAPVEKTGRTAGSSANIALDNTRRYFVSVLPDALHAMSGGPVAPGQGSVTITVHNQPIPTAQITILAFVDQNPVNNGFDTTELGLGGAQVVIADFGGAISQDAFGNPLGTIYSAPGVVSRMGTGVITTLTKTEFDTPGMNPHNLKVGEAVIKNLAPGKYGVIVIPPRIDDAGNQMDWVQTTTIEGTPVIDAWVSANEPAVFVEGFGTGFKHVVFGFVKVAPASSPFQGLVYDVLPWNNPATPPTGDKTIEGTLLWNHFAKPPANQGFFKGEPVPEAWVALVDPVTARGLVAVPCDANGHFRIDNVPAGTYTLVWFDKPLDGLFGFSTVKVAATDPVVKNLGDILVFRWFGTFEGTVFHDANENGFRDAGEAGIMEQNVNIRFRDGSIYQAQPTDPMGQYSFGEVFPFFKWLVVEVDFARYKATGLTVAVDDGGSIPAEDGWVTPSFGKLNPQPQAEVNPNTGNNLSRTETGPVLTQAMHLFLNQTNVVDWGKTVYAPGENGGISGVVFYDTTRAEDDPRTNGGETWQPGIPNVQVALYRDDFNNKSGRIGPDGKIDDVTEDGSVKKADVDNLPFGWAYQDKQGKWLTDPAKKGPEDVDRNDNGQFDTGDAVAIARTDSWDSSKPTGCIQDLPLIHGQLAGRCADNYSTWNQVRPGVFDGGYAFTEFKADGLSQPGAYEPLAVGTYIVEAAVPPGYVLVKEEDKNVDFGDEYVPGPLLVAPACVGDAHLVPGDLTLFPGVTPVHAGETRPLCDRKQVRLADGKNAAADFFLFTEVPKAARAVGFANNDLAAEFNMASPNFGEKLSPSWIPVAFKDWTGKEITRVYADEYGSYNALLPSTFTMNVPAPSGVSPSMMTLVLNDPILPNGEIDPYHNPTFSVTPWTFQYMPGTTSYLDTPLVPLAAFARHGGSIDTEPQSGTPVIKSVMERTGAGGGPVVCSDAGGPTEVWVNSVGVVEIVNPNYDPGVTGSPYRVTRNHGFGASAGRVTLDGAPLPVLEWGDLRVRVSVPTTASTGRLMLVNAAGVSTEVGVTLNVVNCGATQVLRIPNGHATIQAAIDDPATLPGALIIVKPGTYRENVIMHKPVRLQGSGAGGTYVNANPATPLLLQAWHARVAALGGAGFVDAPFRENEAPAVLVVGQAPGFANAEPFDTPGEARIDGFTLAGSKAGGGVFAATGAHDLVVSNNVVTNNQGSYAGGIAVGTQEVALGLANERVVIRQNKIHRNGGTQGPGGVALHAFSADYLVEDNIVAGNLSRFNGGGIGQLGFCGGENRILGNRVLYNENFFGGLLAAAGEGGGIYVGGGLAGGTGTGDIVIDRNLIQGNLAGSGNGGGIRAFAVNGADLALDPAEWHQLTITNNMIVNNVAALSGAGISLQDALRARIENNTIANNDTTATAALAFEPGNPVSTPQPAGVAAHAHSAPVAAVVGPGFSDPVLVNNIVRGNRSFFNDNTLNGGAGGLAPNAVMPEWDLAVVGTAGALSPENCILSHLVYGDGSDYTGSGNREDDPAFYRAVVNELSSATILDEGGNNITVRFKPLLPTVANYHVFPGSPAINNGQANGVTPDFDGQARPQGAAYDIGADEYLQVPATALRVITPNGGEIFPAGSTITIRWEAPAATYHHYSVEYSLNGGGAWTLLVGNTTALSHVWTLPTPTSNRTNALVRVNAFNAANSRIGRDASDFGFTVEVVRLLSPNGGEIVSGGTVWPITWDTFTSTGVTNVRIERAVNGSGVYTPIATVGGNPGSYNWNVPAVTQVSLGNRIRVVLLNGAANIGQDLSDNTFSVRP